MDITCYENTLVIKNNKWNKAFGLIFLDDNLEEEHYVIQVKEKYEQFLSIFKSINEKIPISYIYSSHGGIDGSFMDFHFLSQSISDFKLKNRDLIKEIKEIIEMNYIEIINN